MKSTILFLFFALICAVSSICFAQQAEVILANNNRRFVNIPANLIL